MESKFRIQNASQLLITCLILRIMALSSTQELSRTLHNIQYTEGDSFDVICDNLQNRYGFLKRLRILGDLTSSQFATFLSSYQQVPLMVADIETDTTYLFTFHRTPGNPGVSVDYRVAGNGTSQTNMAARARATPANNAMTGPRVEYNDAETGANQTNSAAGIAASACHNRARGPGTSQTNTASMCQIL